MDSPTVCEHRDCTEEGFECLDFGNHHLAFFCEQHAVQNGFCRECGHRKPDEELKLGEGVCNDCHSADERHMKHAEEDEQCENGGDPNLSDVPEEVIEDPF